MASIQQFDKAFTEIGSHIQKSVPGFSMAGVDIGDSQKAIIDYIKTLEKKVNRETKPFDITKHEFSDSYVSLSRLGESKIELKVDDCGIDHYFTQNKKDIIAIAKALGVTAEDSL